MASTLTLKSDGYGGRILRLYCTQTKDISNNKSKISWTLYSEGGSVNYYSTGPTTVKINGTQVYYKERTDWTTYEFPAAKGSVSGSTYVSHNSNGSKSITVELSTAIYYGSVNSYTSNWTLDSIPRKATVTSLANFNDTENPVIYFDNPGGFKLKPILQIYNDDYTLAYKLVRSKGSYSSPYTFTLSDSERTEMRNATNKQSEYLLTYVGLETYNGDESLGISNAKATYSIINANPVVSMTVSVNNGSLPSKFNGLWIQGKSRANVSLEATGVYSASIKSYYANVDGKTYNSQSFTSDVILNSGTRTVYGYAKDSRNLVGSTSKSISVVSYSKPLVIPIGTENSILCYRSDGNGVRVGNSTSVWVKAKRNYSKITSESTQLNLCSLQWRRKLSSESWNDTVHLWSDLISSSSTTTDEYSALIADTVFDLTESYTVQIRAIDDIGENDIKTLDIPTQDVALHLGKGGKNVSFGGYCDYSKPYSAQSNWDFYIKGKQIKPNISYRTNGSVLAKKDVTNEVCSMTIPEEGTYLLLGIVESGTEDSNSYVSASFTASSGGTLIINKTARTTMASGGGVTTFDLLLAEGNETTVTLCSYGYSTVMGYYLRGNLLAIRLD